MVSFFELFKIGIGPSSSHTVGPMIAAKQFLEHLAEKDQLSRVHQLTIELYGSLALTGEGHGTDKALLLGLLGFTPENVNVDAIPTLIDDINQHHTLNLLQQHSIHFDPNQHLRHLTAKTLPYHTNGMRFSVEDDDKQTFLTQIYYSVGGGFIVREDQIDNPPPPANAPIYSFKTGEQLLALCKAHDLTIWQIMLANECTLRSKEEVYDGVLQRAAIMRACIDRGCQTDGILPGGLQVRRRAPGLYRKLIAQGPPNKAHPDKMLWLNTYALAVNEENAAGSRIVTAPTNGAAGIIPAVLEYYRLFHTDPSDQGIVEFLLTTAAIGTLYKKGASISGAEVGCQGEVGVACSMAAAGYAAVLGGSVAHIENAAEIAMEHNLGLTCDPIDGLVQIPCIERNAMAAVKAVNAARLAMAEEGDHKVSLDKVIQTMRQTGHDMMTIYKETSLGGLAVNIPEC